MRASTKLLTGFILLAAFQLLTNKSDAQHYANLSPDGSNNTTNTTSKKVKKSIVSFGFFSPLNQHISIGYDQLIGTDLILSTELGLIGPGFATSAAPPSGGFVEVGTKLFFSPTWSTDGMRRVNAMQGGYFKPQVVVSVFSDQSSSYLYANRTYTGVGLILNIGHQWILSNSFALDMYFGIGYNLSYLNNSGGLNNSFSTNEPSSGNYYSYTTLGSTSPIAFSAGVNLGVPF